MITIRTMVVAVVIALVVGFAGGVGLSEASKKGVSVSGVISEAFASQYSIESYRLTTYLPDSEPDKYKWGSCLNVTVKGPAAKLAVIVTSPQGESSSEIINKDDMVTNRRTVQVSIAKGRPQLGIWALTVKTVDPEKVVCKKEISFSLTESGQIKVASAN
jgi:hypothetical protein